MMNRCLRIAKGVLIIAATASIFGAFWMMGYRYATYRELAALDQRVAQLEFRFESEVR